MVFSRRHPPNYSPPASPGQVIGLPAETLAAAVGLRAFLPAGSFQSGPIEYNHVFGLARCGLLWFGDVLMAKSKKKAETVFLVCQETGDYNYTIRRKPGGEKLKLKKYCPRLRKHTVHVEKKK
jgi:large subunit ribosomal protein L33